MVELAAVNRPVVGSSPTEPVILKFALDKTDNYGIIKQHGAEGKPVASDTLIRCS